MDANATLLNVSFQGAGCRADMTLGNKALTVGFGLIFCLSVCGNALVMVTIVQQKWMRTVTNLYLLNLAVSDLLLIVICMPPTLLGLLLKCFIFGPAFCRLVSFLQPVSVTASAYTLGVIALERYFAICKPLSSRHWQTKGHAMKMILLVWTIAIISNVSSLATAELVEYRTGQWNCAMAPWMTAELKLVHTVFVAAVLFLLPLSVMVILYGLVIRNLWLGIQLETQASFDEVVENRLGVVESRTLLARISASLRLRPAPEKDHGRPMDSLAVPNHPCSAGSRGLESMALRSTHSERSLLAKKRVIRMLIVVVMVFAICWTPLYSLHIYYHSTIAFRLPLHFKTFNVAYQCFLVLAYCSTCSNPIAYCFFNRKFRQAFLLAFGCRRWAGKDLTMIHTNSYHPSQNTFKPHGPPRQVPTINTRLFVADAASAPNNSARRTLKETSPTAGEEGGEGTTVLLNVKSVSMDFRQPNGTAAPPQPNGRRRVRRESEV